MKKRHVLGFALLGAVAFGCTTILGDFDVAPGATSSGDVPDAAPSTEDGASADDSGSLDSGSLDSGLVDSGDPPRPEFAEVPRSATGWKDVGGAPIAIKLKPTGIPGTRYECRTRPLAAFGGGQPTWEPCDGASGAAPVHRPTRDPATPEGTYVTGYRYKVGTFTSPEIRTRYYAHESLDQVATCPRPGVANDGPHFTDLQYLAAAKAFANANANVFRTDEKFPPPGNQRSDDVYLGNPWIKIPFVHVSHTIAMNGSEHQDDDPWPAANENYLFNERSLRHRWVMSEDRTLIMVTRQYIHPLTNDCKQLIAVGNPSEESYGPPGRGVRKMNCEAYVLNSRGNAICLVPNPENPSQPTVALFDRRLASLAGTQLAGNVTTYANNATVTSAADAFTAAMVGSYLRIGPYQRWYQIATFGGTKTVYLSEPFETAGTYTARLAVPNDSTVAYVIPTGFAKLHQDAHAWATGKKRIPAVTGAQIAGPRPSWRTKCETPGCDAGKPWLTYLPP